MRSDSSGPMPAIGSSSSSRRALVASASPTSSCALLAMRKVPASASARPARPTDASIAARLLEQPVFAPHVAARRRGSCRCAPAPASAMLSSTLNSRNRLVTWYERARPMPHPLVERHRGDVGAVEHDPATVGGEARPTSWWTSVVLPAPLGPMSAWISPRSTSSETPSVATTPPKRFAKLADFEQRSSGPCACAKTRPRARCGANNTTASRIAPTQSCQ